jgi:hypothetical protein
MSELSWLALGCFALATALIGLTIIMSPERDDQDDSPPWNPNH